MTAPTLCQMPAQCVAGDTLQWRHPGGIYPASAGWSLYYALVGTAAVYQVTATAAGDDYAIAVDASTTAEWAPGRYQVQAYVAKDDERHTVGAFAITVQPDLAAATVGIDTRSHAQKVLDAINAWLENSAPVAGSFEINGRKISYYPITDLLKLRDRYRLEVAMEQRGHRPGGHRVLAVL